MALPTIRQFQYFKALTQTKSFSRAAAQCYVTQSTLSAGIRELEDILGHPLFDRSGRAVTLTPEGRGLEEKIDAVLTMTESILEESRAMGDVLSGPLRMGVIPTIAPYLLPVILPALQMKFPSVQLQVREDMTERLLEALDNNDIDMALMAFPYDTARLSRTILFDEPFLLACGPNSPLAGKKRCTLEDLAASGEKILLLEDGHCLRDHALAACRVAERQVGEGMRATSLPTLIQMVHHGYGITLLPRMATGADVLPPGIVLVPFREPGPHRTIGLCWRDNHSAKRHYDSLASTLRETLVS